VNYESRIETLRAKGVLDAAQAEKLKRSFESRRNIVAESSVMKRRYILETVGLVWLAVVVFYVVFITFGNETVQSVEDVTQSLNDAHVAGITDGGTVVWAVLLAAGAVYAVLFFASHAFYRTFRKQYESRLALQKDIEASEALKKELESLAGKWLSEETKAPDITIGDDARSVAIEVMVRIQNEILSKKERLHRLQAECASKRGRFPFTLAALAGEIPSCN
jgi:hypothetical protein